MKIWVSKVQCTNKSYSKMSKSMQVPLYFSTFLLAVFHSANTVATMCVAWMPGVHEDLSVQSTMY